VYKLKTFYMHNILLNWGGFGGGDSGSIPPVKK
jgi:hypothetical protein